MNLLITPPSISTAELEQLNQLFVHGLRWLQLRLPNASVEEYAAVLEAIAPEYRDRVILCDHYALAAEYGVGGAYFSYHKLVEGDLPPCGWTPHEGAVVAVGAHSIDELRQLRFTPTYALLSPVFDSLSKQGYRANRSLLHCADELRALPFPVLAMGGVTPDNRAECLEAGFAGIAAIGAVWGSACSPVEAYLRFGEPEMLSIAGHDPSGGAGVIADYHTAQRWGVRCHTVVTALTVQTERRFESASPTDSRSLLRNLSLQLEQHPAIRVAKVGMTLSPSQLEEVVSCLKRGGVRYLIWDCMTHTTADTYTLLSPSSANRAWLQRLLTQIDLLTPNSEEAEEWLGSSDPRVLQQICDLYGCAILLKGGHQEVHSPYLSTDTLLRPHTPILSWSVPRAGSPKHGTGCQLSASIAALIAQGYPLPRACREAQLMISEGMQARSSLLMPLLCESPLHRMREKMSRSVRLQYVTNRTAPDQILDYCQRALAAGVRWIQLRMKEASTAERIALGRSLRTLTERYRAVLIIDDDVEAALCCNADGVHIGINDMPLLEARRRLGHGKIIGYTCHNSKELLVAHHGGANYVGVGPYRFTSTKQRLAPLLGLEGIATLAQLNAQQPYPLPMVAIGGITANDLPDLALTGITGVALSGEIEQSLNLESHCRELIDLISHYYSH